MHMNYIDRKKLGIEELFAGMSPILSPSNEMNAEETVRVLCEQHRRTRKHIAKKINTGIKILTDDSTIDVGNYLNDDIRELAKYPVNGDGMNRLLPFFKWLMEIHRQNALETEKSRYLLNDAAANMDYQTRDFVKACSSNLMGHGVSFLQEGNSVIMNIQERFWGKASIVFPETETKFIGTFPIVGMFFWMDADHNNGRYTFSFLINVEFGDDDIEKRILQDRNWVRFTFECACPHLVLETFDYGKYLTDFGKRGHGFIESWCNEILSKETMLGSSSMSNKESALLPLAKVLRLSYQLADIENNTLSGHLAVDGNLSEKVLETLGNRYRFNQFEELLKNAGQEDLYNLLKEAMEAWSCSDFGETSKNIWSFARLLREKERKDTIRPLYKKITELMCDCTSEFNGKSKMYGTYVEAEEKMREIIEPTLESLGFTGSFPHYRRRRGKKGEYITVLTSNVSKRTFNGVMMYFFSIAAAVKKLEKQNRDVYFAAGMPFEETTAEDCRSVSHKNAKYTELGGIFDNVNAVINVDIFDGISDEEKDSDNAVILNKFVYLAAKSMKGRKAPRWYKKMRRSSAVKFKPETTLESAVAGYLPFGLYLSVLLTAGYILCDKYFVITDYIPQLTGGAAVILALLIGMLSALVCGLLKLRSLKKHIWRY